MDTGVVACHNKCQTEKAQYLCILDPHKKLITEGVYDIGGTYDERDADFWFTFQSSPYLDNYLIKLFICNRKRRPYSIEISGSNKLDITTPLAYVLSEPLVHYTIDNSLRGDWFYLKTFNFTKSDVELLKCKNLLVSINLTVDEKSIFTREVLLSVKAFNKVETLLTDSQYSDIKLRSSDGAVFNAHKFILASQSEKIKRTIQECGDSDTITFHDIDNDTLKVILCYLYTGSIKDTSNNDYKKIFIVAKQYLLDGLSTLAQYFLQSQINSNNVIDLLVLSQEYNTSNLQNRVCQYIENHPEILHSDSWNNLNHTGASKLLTEYILKQKKG